MKNNNKIIIVLGIIILGIFAYVGLYNLQYASREESYYSTDIIKSVDYINNKLYITTNDDIISICVKQTKSTPSSDSLCWIDTINNQSSLAIYENKTYHIWAKDNQNTISYYAKYNTINDN